MLAKSLWPPPPKERPLNPGEGAATTGKQTNENYNTSIEHLKGAR